MTQTEPNATTRESMHPADARLSQVRAYFEEPARYIGDHAFNIMLRAETVNDFIAGFKFQNGLDVGCGDGSISTPLLNSKNHFTFLDLSSAMISLTQAKVHTEVMERASFVNDNVMSTALKPSSYDLIICLGVIAHVDSPDALIARLSELLQPGGRLILEFSDCYHLLGRTHRVWQWLAALRKPRNYRLNELSYSKIKRMLRSHKLRLISKFRFSRFLPFSRRISGRARFDLQRKIFGSARANRMAWLGDEYICLLTKD